MRRPYVIHPLLALVLVVVAAVLVLGFAGQHYLEERQRSIEVRTLRALAVLGEQIEWKVDALARTVEVAALKAPDPQKAIGLVPGLEWADVGTDRACQSLRSPTSQVHGSSSPDPGNPSTRVAVRMSLQPVGPRLPQTRSFGSDAGPSGSDKSTDSLYMLYEPDKARDNPRAPICAHAELATLVNGLLGKGRLDDFDVVVLRGNGSVVFEHGRRGFRLIGIPTVVMAPKPEKEGATPTATTAGDTLPSLDQLQRSTRLSEMTVAGIAYKLFTQPVRLSTPVDGDSSPWVLGALVASSAFRRQALAVPFAYLSAIPLLFLVAILVSPALKLWTIGPRGRLTAMDVHFLSVCCVASGSLAVILACSVYGYRHLAQSDDETLAQMSRQLRSAFRKELEGAAEVLQAFAEDTRPATDGAGSTADGGGKDPDAHQVLPALLSPGSLASVSPRVRQALTDYPFVDTLVWADAGGEQKRKWTSSRTATSLINIGPYNSFQDAKHGRLWSVRYGSSPASEQRCVLHVQISPNTGGLVATLAMPLQSTDSARGAGDAGVAVVLPQLISVVDPVLPPEFGFAMIDDSGQVWFHSDKREALHGNVLEEWEDGQALGSLLAARRAGYLTAECAGTVRRLYVRPIRNTPLSLIVFHDREMLRTVAFESAVTCLVLVLLYIVLYLVVLITVRALWRRDRGDWLWPSPHRSALYWCMFSVAVAVLVVDCGAVLTYNSAAAVIVSVAYAGMTVAFTVAALTRGAEYPPSSLRAAGGAAIVACAGVALAGIALSGACATSRALAEVATITIAAVMLLIAFTNVVLVDHHGEIVVNPRLAFIPLDASQKYPHAFATGYVLAVLTVLILVSVNPTIALYRDAYEQAVESWTRLGLVGFADAMASRVDRIRRDIEVKGLDWPPPIVTERLRYEQLDNAWSGRIRHPVYQRSSWEAAPAVGERAFDRQVASRMVAALGSLIAPDACRGLTEGERAAGDRAELCRMMARHPSAVMALWPIYSEQSGRLRSMSFDRSSDSRWRARREGGEMLVRLRDDKFELAHEPPGDDSAVAEFAATIPPFPAPRAPWVSLIAVLAALGVAFKTLQAGASKIFGLDVDELPAAPSPNIHPSRGQLLLRPSTAQVEAAKRGAYVIDLDAIPDPRALRAQVRLCPPDTRVVITHFERRLDDADWNRAKLALVEELVLAKRKDVVIASDLDPLSYYSRRLRSVGDTKANEQYVTEDEIDRWARVLARMKKVRAESPKPLAAASEESVAKRQATLCRECHWTPRLRGIMLDVMQDERWRDLTCKQLVLHIADVAEAYYRKIWSLCTDEQRLVLIQLANEGFVNPNNWGIVSQLMRRQLIRREPAFRIMNESFREFIRKAESAEQVQQWERAAGASAWDKLRGVLVGLLIVVGAFLFLTQRESFNTWLAFLPAVGAAAAALMNLLGLFGGNRASTSKTS